MVSFHFVDLEGTEWMVVPGLPADYPDVGEDIVPAGFTFRSSTGEVRVLPRAAIPRRASMPTSVPRLGTSSRVANVEPSHWEDLLRHALPWPPV